MRVRIILVLCLLACAPAWCQVTATDAEADQTSDSNSQLLVPPPVSGRAYSSTFSGETESNFLSGGITFTGGYSNNVSYGSTPVSDMSYSLWPTIALNKTTYRMHFVLDYAPGFTFYQRITSLNQANQNLGMSLQYRLSPNFTATLREGLQKTSNAFDQPNPLSGTEVSGSLPTQNVAITVPAADMVHNTTGAQLTYQLGGDSMLGGGANYGLLDYTNQANTSGLFNSRSVGGSLFYSTKIHDKNYLGISYQYENSLSFQTDQPSTETHTQTIFLFFSMFLRPNLSVSISGGPQHYSSVQSTLPAAASWQPMTMVSMNWQGERTTVAASYARTVGGGGGLNGTFHSNNVGMSLLWRANRNWTTGLSGTYSNFQNLTPFFASSSPGGHTLSGTASLQRTLNNHTNLQFGYNWAHQSYPSLQTVSNNPNINRVFVTISFTFTKPLQR